MVEPTIGSLNSSIFCKILVAAVVRKSMADYQNVCDWQRYLSVAALHEMDACTSRRPVYGVPATRWQHTRKGFSLKTATGVFCR